MVKGRTAASDADQFTHAQELVYRWEEVDQLLTGTGWHLVGWPPRSGMPDQPGDIVGGEALRRLDSMSAMEQAAFYEKIVKPARLYFLATPA
jgi:hypothetical protein